MVRHVRDKASSQSKIIDRWPEYQPQVFEARLQDEWEQQGLYRADNTSEQAKFYCLDFFPYPSGEGLHVGHCRNYVPTDVISRFKRMQGYHVLHPMGWDAFGEPTEQFAIEHGVHPRLTTDRNTANFKRQMRLIGTSYDWSREIDSSLPEYYRWTQWFFLLLYQRGLAYRDTNWQWWCPVCQTTLSSHEVSNGVCWRGHSGVYRREVPAWYFRITAYADELLYGLDDIDWPEPIKAMQRNWIGRSQGCEIIFTTESGEPVPVFTTRPDTIFGVTFFALAPEHPLVAALTAPEYREQVMAYAAEASLKSEVERMAENRQKSGVFTGGYLINPVNQQRVPVWVADFVLPTYGTGAVMGVPAHDERDYEFARQHGIAAREVIVPEDGRVPGQDGSYVEPGKLVNSGPYDGLSSAEAGERIIADLEASGAGQRKVQYRMRDWLISRQRYWGTPIPIVYCESCGTVPVPEEQLPVELPELEDYAPDGSGRSPLARVDSFVNTTCPVCQGPAQRETDTLGGFACSSWYFLRFASPHYNQAPFDPQAVAYWLPVDLYVGGAEHAVLHLLYARFWTQVLADAGLIGFREPFRKLLNQGQLMGPDGRRMSKSRGNVVIPDEMVAQYGADALRLYVLFVAPFEQDVNWQVSGINGTRRFLNRVWSLYAETYTASGAVHARDAELERALHATIRDVTERIAELRFNTMVSVLMEFVNLLADRQGSGAWLTRTFHQALETLMILLAPVAPYIAEELWRGTGHHGSVHNQDWPVWDPALARQDTVQIAVQIDGKVREIIQVPSAADQNEVEAQALASPKVRQHLAGRKIRRQVYVSGKILSIVTNR